MTDVPLKAATWRTTHGDISDEEWALIADLVQPYSGGGQMGRPVKNRRRDVVNAIFYVAATGCQWRALPESYPHWNTVHRYHLKWSRDGTWEKIAARLAGLVRENEGRDTSPSAGTVDARSVRATSTVSKKTKGYDAGKKVNGRKTFGIVDTLGLLIAVSSWQPASRTTLAASTSLIVHVGDQSASRSSGATVGSKKSFIEYGRHHHVSVEVVNKIHAKGFEVLPKRWIVERTWSWLMNSRRLQVDDERDPIVTEGFIWAAHSRYLLRRLTEVRVT